MIPTEVVGIGSKVSYEDMANPRQVGEVVTVDLAGAGTEFGVRWEDGTECSSDLRQSGWHLVAEGGLFDGADILSIYTRAQAIEDGVLVDVSETAREAGIVFPVAMTRAAFEDCVTWDEGNAGIQDERGRLWDVVWMTRCAVRAARSSTDRLRVELWRVPNTAKSTTARKVELVAACGPGDNAEPVITLMLPGED